MSSTGRALFSTIALSCEVARDFTLTIYRYQNASRESIPLPLPIIISSNIHTIKRTKQPLSEISPNKPVKATPTALGHKRKSDALEEDAPTKETNDTASDSDAILDGVPIDKNPDQVRRQITRFIDNGGMKIGEFQGAIGVSSNAYLRFMRQSGPTKGLGCDTYDNAWAFFKKRELNGVPMPKAKRAKTKEKEVKGPKKNEGMDLSDIHLDGEEKNKVPIFDTAGEVRKKISAHLRKPDTNVTAFGRELAKMYNGDDSPKGISSAQIQNFRQKKGPMAGCTSNVYYAAYVLFEKTRIQQGKGKSKHREEMERRWPRGVEADRDVAST